MMETLDARGLRCPWPVLRLARAMRSSTIVSILVDDPAAPEEIAVLAQTRGWRFRVNGDSIIVDRRAM